ncbi:hypothetical protein Ocin01_03921 [Orchesella cincta]|uniref:Uncharacterized protein n=1 Tax=Orchesella cincta TaxID=48709 RepID=A0A1D2NBY2_ORCCI|nr:hypothetical protein Ocin01_03921 [Orchesella cincta]
MNRLGLILATVLAVTCWITAVSSRSLDVVSESETSQNDDLNPINVPALLEFEGGEGDNDVDGVRDKRTPRFIFRAVSCLFTFLVNPNCLQGVGGGAGGGGGSSPALGSNRRQQQQPYYMISLPRYNDTDSNSTSTEYPIYPIESTSEYPEEQPSRPTNPILAMIQWKLNLIPNLIRRFMPGFGGGRRDGVGSTGSGSGLNFGLGLGGGRFAGLFGGGNRGRRIRSAGTWRIGGGLGGPQY